MDNQGTWTQAAAVNNALRLDNGTVFDNNNLADFVFEAEIPLDPDLHRHANHGRYEAQELAIEMLKLQDRPTAIFAASDTQALGVLEAARSLGLQVPEDLSIIGYDDLDLATYLNLTTVRQLLFESGQIGVHLLLRVIADPDAPVECEVLPTELVVRGTTVSIR